MQKSFFFLLLLAGYMRSFGQDATVQTPAAYTTTLNNYLRSWVAVKPDTAAANFVTGVALNHSRLTSQYFDGLGRPVETVAKKGSLRTGDTAVDMVLAQVYDYLGREPRKYLPFAASNYGSNTSTSDGGFKLNPFQEQQNFYSDNNANSPIKGQGETYYYAKNELESSPLSRVNKSFAAGDNWVHNGKGLKMNYWVNKVSDSVRIWKVTNSGTVGVFASYSCDSLYYAGELFKNVTSDENDKEVIEFKDREGKVVLRKVQNTASVDTGTGKGHTGWLCTYYVYDDNNLLRCVIQPGGVELLLANSWNITWNSGVILNEQCFRYEYDGRRRTQMKKVPGAVEAYRVYDARDRLVLMQDANMRSGSPGKWLYTLYDSLNRPVATGLWNNSSSLATHYSAAYGSTAYPNLSGQTYQELTTTFYDNYNWRSSYGNPLSATRSTTNDGYLLAASNTIFPYPQDATVQSSMIKGMVTGTRIKVLDSSLFLFTVNFYDDWHRVIQVQGTNFTGGTDAATTQYAFAGQPVLLISLNQKSGTNAQTSTVLTQLNYDSLLRPVEVQKKFANSLVNSGAMPYSWTTTVQNKYDVLGHVVQKNLGNKPGAISGTPLANQVYAYNIRGWLLSVNKAYVDTSINNDQYFGMELGYDKNASLGIFTAQYNGNVAGMLWKGEGDQAKRKYDFSYDATNRLTAAGFNQYVSGSGSSATFDKSAGIDYSVSAINYDANGNILALQEKGWKLNSSPTIDSLIYGYQTGSNKLARVTDGITDTAVRLGDFRDGTNAGDDYNYDANGNLIVDNNKKIDLVKYNYLNLPDTIHVQGKGNVVFWYDAVGNKLRKVTMDSTWAPVKKTTSLYLGTGVFMNDTLQLLSHEEGRVRINSVGNGFVYDYFMKDHLGNTRMVVTEEAQTDSYPNAGLEDGTIATERLYYANLDSGRVNKSTVPGYPNDTYTNPNNYIQQLSGSSGAHILGSNSVIKVMAGDTINIRANSWYRQNGTSPGTPSGPLASLLVGLAGGVVGTDPGHFLLSPLQQTGVLDPGINSFLSTVNTDYASHNTKPKAYLNWVLFDEQFHYVAGGGNTNSGFQQVGADTVFTTHTITGQVMTRSGWLFVYVSNETPNINVFFDNLQLTHIRGRIMEETHYYPYGLSMSGISYLEAGKPENKFRYNGKELQNKEFKDASGLDWYDYGARMYDPQIGRWHVIDGKAEKYYTMAPYVYAGNDPLKFIDPGGDTLLPVGTAAEIKQINSALAIVAKTNPAQYDAMNNATEVVQIMIGNIIPPKPVNTETGNRTTISYEGVPSHSDQFGSFDASLTEHSALKDDDPSPTGFKFSRGGTNNEEPDRVPISEEEANSLVRAINPMITLDVTLSGTDLARVLAHELGHGAYTLTHKASAKLFPAKKELKGHDEGNENGKAADEAQKEFDEKYKAVLEEIKRERKKRKDQ
jgi:RHS repeat-associated protein